MNIVDDIPDRQVRKCRSCDAEIVFLKTKSGKSIPVDRERLDAGDAAEDAVEGMLFDRSCHQSHFATCPDADQHRKPR